MKKGLIIGLAATAVAGAVASLVSVGVSAGPLREPAASADEREVQMIPAHEVATVVRAGAYRTAYNSGPRIIHVPQPDDAVATGDYRDNVNGDINGDDARHVEDAADPEPPKPVRRTRPTKRHRSAAPPPTKRHIVTSAPPPPPQAGEGKDKDEALRPVYPTPGFGANASSGEKFAPPPRQN